MNADFLTIVFGLTLIAGLISLVDIIFWQAKRKVAGIEKQPKVVEYSRSFFPVLLLVLLIRAFVGQIYVIPTGSLEPTIMPKAYVIINQFAYGLRFWGKKLVPIGEPKRGDIVVFHSPVTPRIDLIKRVIGLPGDHISYINRVLYINGKEAKQKFITYARTTDVNHSVSWTVKVLQEDLLGVKHDIYVCASKSCPTYDAAVQNFYNLIVPKGEYFMMGDNRDDSEDSRYWGFMPEHDITGKAWRILLSWNRQTNSIRRQQIWKKL